MWTDEPSKSFKRSRYLKDQAATMARVRHTTHHSARGATLRLLVEYLEASGTPYRIEAWPGQGYALTSLPGDVPGIADSRGGR